MLTRDVNLKFDTTNGYLALSGVLIALFLLTSLLIGIGQACLLFFLPSFFFIFLVPWIAARIAKHIDGDILLSFPKMYKELFAHTPIQIDYRLDLYNYLTAICYDGEFLYIIEKNKMVSLKWSDVRQWDWAIITPQKQTTTGGSPGQAFQGFVNDSFANLAPALKAMQNSGIRLTVKNLDHPQWFYNTGSKKDAEVVCRKWEEIFHQFDDGVIPP
ncbi:MAG: hypothetical protein ABF641_11760 [Acetobacter sp.]